MTILKRNEPAAEIETGVVLGVADGITGAAVRQQLINLKESTLFREDARTSFARRQGWKAGADMGARLSRWIARARPGDVLVIDDMYGISGGNWTLPDNVHIVGLHKSHCGFVILDAHADTAAANGVRQRVGVRIRLGVSGSVQNLTFTQAAYYPATTPRDGLGALISMSSKRDCRVQNVHFENAWGFTCVGVVHTPHAVVTGCKFDSRRAA